MKIKNREETEFEESVMRERLSDATWPTWRDSLRCYNHHHHYYFDYYYYYYCYLATLAEEPDQT